MSVTASALSQAVARHLAGAVRVRDAQTGAGAGEGATGPTSTPKAPATDSYTPGEPVAAGRSLLQRLAEAARRPDPLAGATPGPSLTLDPATATQGLTKALEGLFGVSIASISYDLTVDHRHQASGSAALATTSSPEATATAWQAEYRAVTTTSLSAAGTITTSDGQSFAFTFDYLRRTEVAAQTEGRSVTTAPPAPADQAAPRTDDSAGLLLRNLRRLAQQTAEDHQRLLRQLWPAPNPTLPPALVPASAAATATPTDD